jgi:putative oxidoreductase
VQEIRQIRRTCVLSRFLNAKFVPSSTDAGLLLLRVGTGLILFLRHGWEKVSQLILSNPHFPDPIHIGHSTSWVIAMLADGICSLLIILGVGTRWLSLYCFVNILVAWSLVHHFTFWGKTPGADHGELIALYLSAFLALMVAGPGRYSVDAMVPNAPEAKPQVAHA